MVESGSQKQLSEAGNPYDDDINAIYRGQMRQSRTSNMQAANRTGASMKQTQPAAAANTAKQGTMTTTK